MKRLFGVLVLMVALAAWLAPAAAQDSLTYEDLVKRLVDLERLSVLPAAGEKCALWSSWDRGSQYDEAAGKYVHWDANGDGGGMIRKEGNLNVMAEMEGPGCIWRTWSALPQKGHVKIFLDGAAEPAVDLPFENYFDGKTAPFNYPMLSYRLEDVGSRGQNLYYPIPYQKSCKIVAENGWGAYYHFNYATYPKGTKLPTFSAALAAENAAALKRVDDYFRDAEGTDPAGRREGAMERIGMTTVDAGKTATVAQLDGPAAITAIRVSKMHFNDRADEMAALRKLALRITWDGQAQPAVWCPLGDFFGTAPGVNKFKSLPTGMTDDGFYALWYMPFAKSALVELANDDTVPRAAQFAITSAPLGRSFEGLGHFHCKWHRDICPLPKDRWPDWVMVRTGGRGRFVGAMLHIWNPRGGWWGEGDEKFFVDGEKFPSTIGTGSEDYFGYAWGNPTLFQKPFHAQTMTQNNSGHQSVVRWHIPDNVPFQTSFEGCIEKYFPNDGGTLYACTAWWYLAPGGEDPIGPTPVEERDGYCTRTNVTAGGFKLLNEYKGTVSTQGMAGFPAGKWKNDDQLWWTGAQPGDKLELAVPVKKAGTYQVSVVLTKARDYGIVQLYLDGKKAGEPINLYNPEVIATEPMPIGTHQLAEGDHTLGVEIVGADEKADKAYMFGLDYVIFEMKP